MDMDIKTHAFNLGSSYINKAVSTGRFGKVREYFQIDNVYLIKKMGLMMYPYLSRKWTDTTNRDSQQVLVAYPDLYIPFMGVITYILLIAGELEVKNEFKPEILGKIWSRIAAVDALEVLVLKVTSFFFESKEIEVLDVASFVGYKYFYVILRKISGYFLNRILRKIFLLFLFVSSVVFLGRSLKTFLITNNQVISIKKRRIYFLFLVVGIDVLVSLFLK